MEAAAQLGVTVQAVYGAIKEKRLTAMEDANGKIVINSDTMRDEWNSKSAFRRMRSTPPTNQKVKKTKKRNSKTDESIPDYEESKARTEHLKAELLELERQEKEKSLVPVEEVNTMWQTIITNTRNKMLGVAAKAQQRLPDLDNSAISCIDDIVREALEELSTA